MPQAEAALVLTVAVVDAGVAVEILDEADALRVRTESGDAEYDEEGEDSDRRRAGGDWMGETPLGAGPMIERNNMSTSSRE